MPEDKKTNPFKSYDHFMSTMSKFVEGVRRGAQHQDQLAKQRKKKRKKWLEKHGNKEVDTFARSKNATAGKLKARRKAMDKMKDKM